MPYTLIFRPAAAKQFRNLSREIQQRLRPKLDALAYEPRPQGCEKLAGGEDVYRIRVGAYRILYQIEDDVLTVYVVRVANRREAYR